MKFFATHSGQERGPVRALGGVCLVLCAIAALDPEVLGQSPSTVIMPQSTATQVPLSGRQQQGSVTVTQQSQESSGNGNSVNVIENRIMLQGPYMGSTPQGTATGDVMPLTLEDALKLGLRFNLAALNQSAAVMQAEGQRTVSRSTLLPNLSTAVSEVFERLNLHTEGISLSGIPESVKFNYYDARAVRLQQSVFDLVRLRNLHGATENVKANIAAARNARDLVVLAVGGSYVQLIATKARMEAAAAQVDTSTAIFHQAEDRFAAGLNARIDVTRSQVQLQTEQQRLRQLQADFETQKLQLARIVGLALGQRFDTVEDYPYAPLTNPTVEDALTRANTGRADLQAADAAVKTAEFSVKAAHAEHLPSLVVAGDFGAAGTTPTSHSTGVYTASGTLNIPLYEGGRIHGDIVQAEATLKNRKAERDDIRGQIDEDIRQAFIDLSAAADQVDVAKSNVDLAHETLMQSRDRFAAGIADTVEVVQAEQTVVQADDDYITAVYEHNLGKVSLARAMGNAEQTLPQLLRK